MLLLCATLLLVACGESRTVAGEGADGATIPIDDGERLDVALDGNPTTGYTWYVAEIDEAVLRQVGEREFDPDSDADGAGGTVTLHFEAVAPGTTPLRLVYRQEHAPDSEAERTWQITVDVGE